MYDEDEENAFYASLAQAEEDRLYEQYEEAEAFAMDEMDMVDGY